MAHARSVSTSVVVALFAAALAPPPAAAPPGEAARGRDLFSSKLCTFGHRQGGKPGGGPALEWLRRPQGPWTLTGRLWNHVPAMFTALAQEGLPWPRISADEMRALFAYLGADPARDPAPDPVQGRLLLVGKGCLKCHPFRGEGGRLGPDLGERRADYAEPAAWAATVWGHTPRMAAAALREGMLYPRFAGDEMVDLLGFLRGGAGAP